MRRDGAVRTLPRRVSRRLVVRASQVIGICKAAARVYEGHDSRVQAAERVGEDGKGTACGNVTRIAAYVGPEGVDREREMPSVGAGKGA